MRKITILSLILIFVLGLWGIKALLAPGFYTSHDGEHHLVRMANYYLALFDGQFPPRWAPNFNGNLGSPIFVFIYPLPYFLGALLHFLGLTFVDSLKLLLGTSYILSGIFFYVWLKPKLGPLPAIVGALFYLWAPYRFLMIFVRAAYPESLAYTFVPLVFWAIDRALERPSKKYLSLGGLAVAGVLLSQNLVGFIFVPLSFFYALLARPWKHRNVLFRLPFLYLLGFSLAAFILVPDAFELKMTKYSELITYSLANLVSVWQLLRSPWGYGFSLPGTNDGMSFQIGLSQLVVVGISICLAGYLLIKKRQSPGLSLCLYSLTVLFLVCVIMIDSPLTQILWRIVPGLNTIDYPWRLLGVTVFTAATLAAWLVAQIKGLGRVVLALFLSLALLVANRNFLRVNQRLDFSNSYLLSFQGMDTHLGEFIPRDRITRSTFPLSQRAQFYDGSGTIDHETFTTSYQRYDITVSPKSNLSKFRINTFYFPGWQIFVDGQKAQLGKNFEVTGGIIPQTNLDVSGMMGVFLPSGRHIIEARFGEDNPRLLADWLSLASLAVAAAMLIL